MEKEKRHIMKIEVSTEAKRRLDKIPESHGMTSLRVFSTIMEWYANQSREVQLRIVAPEGASDRTIARIVLQDMAGGSSK